MTSIELSMDTVLFKTESGGYILQVDAELNAPFFVANGNSTISEATGGDFYHITCLVGTAEANGSAMTSSKLEYTIDLGDFRFSESCKCLKVILASELVEFGCESIQESSAVSTKGSTHLSQSESDGDSRPIYFGQNSAY